MCFRDSFKLMLESVTLTFPECARVLKENIALDPGFKTFYLWCKSKGIPVIIVSSGMAPLIRAVLGNLIGEEAASDITIIANDVRFTDPEGRGDTWEIVFRNPDRYVCLSSCSFNVHYTDLWCLATLNAVGSDMTNRLRSFPTRNSTRARPRSSTATELATFRLPSTRTVCLSRTRGARTTSRPTA